MTHIKKPRQKHLLRPNQRQNCSNPALRDLQILKKPRRVNVEVKLYVFKLYVIKLCIISCLFQSELHFKQPYHFISIEQVLPEGPLDNFMSLMYSCLQGDLM